VPSARFESGRARSQHLETPNRWKRFAPGSAFATCRLSARLDASRYSFDASAAEVGLQGLTPHELRHTCASLAVARGANVEALQRTLGRASAKETLDTYTDLFEDDLDGVATALDEVLAPILVGKVWARPGKGGGPE
jgi:integrase